MKYKDFNEWFFEGDEYNMRSHKFFEALGHEAELAREAQMIVWLKEAFEAGRANDIT